MEDLNVKGMLWNHHHLVQAVANAAFGFFGPFLEYKCQWYGMNLVYIDRFAPSSKNCSSCGYVCKGLKLSIQSWTYREFGTHNNQDFNVAYKVKPLDCQRRTSNPCPKKP